MKNAQSSEYFPTFSANLVVQAVVITMEQAIPLPGSQKALDTIRTLGCYPIIEVTDLSISDEESVSRNVDIKILKVEFLESRISSWKSQF